MEDNFENTIENLLKSTSKEVDNLKEMQEQYYKELNDDQRKELDKILDSKDMAEINKVISDTTNEMISKINSIFNGGNN